MLDSEKMAIAAHLHVLLRRKIGRVTDVEWMVKSREYAIEVIRVARAEPHPDVHEWVDKLEAIVMGTTVQPRSMAMPVPGMPTTPAPLEAASAKRYVSSLR